MRNTMNIAELLNETTANVSDFTRIRNVEPTGDPLLYKFTMTASNMHESLSDLYESKGNKTRAKWHKDMANRLKADANQFLH